MTILASLLALVMMALTGFTTAAGAAALTPPYAPAGASGTGVNAPPIGSQPLAPGLWDAQNYEMPLPAKACPQPPQSLAARLALVNSPIMLDYYGLPHLSQYSGDLAKWQNIVGGMKHQLCQEAKPIRNGKPMVYSNVSAQGLWSGFGNHHYRATDHYAGDGYFLMPRVSSSDGHFQVVSAWVGIGGTDGDALDQAGWEATTTSSGTTYQWFYEYVPPSGGGSGATTFSGSFTPSDQLYFYCNSTGTWTLENITNGEYHLGGTGNPSSQESVEFIMERVTGNELASFGSTYFDNVEWENNNNQWDDLLNNGYVYQWLLQNSHGQTMITLPSWPQKNYTPPGDYFDNT